MSRRPPRSTRCPYTTLFRSFLKRGVNEGFSGGEKKRNEIMQMMLLEPDLCILDETDSGLDNDALQVVADGVRSEEHTSELQSRPQLVCRLLLVKKNADNGVM